MEIKTQCRRTGAYCRHGPPARQRVGEHQALKNPNPRIPMPWSTMRSTKFPTQELLHVGWVTLVVLETPPYNRGLRHVLTRRSHDAILPAVASHSGPDGGSRPAALPPKRQLTGRGGARPRTHNPHGHTDAKYEDP